MPTESAERWSPARLVAVPCALCGHPVAHVDPRVPGALAGGMCLRESCRLNPRSKKPREVYTFERRVVTAAR
jgi:hypothetical protein